MKKILLSLAAVAAVSAAYCFNHNPAERPSALTMDNIEALSGGEAFVSYDKCCKFTGDFHNDMCIPTSGPILYGYRPC